MTNHREDETAGESSSPACSMHQTDDASMGYMAREELTAFLNELLEAERAGARVTLESAHAARSGPIAKLMSDIQRDEARWCAMLARHLKALGITPSMKVGAFYEKAMAITDLGERIAFLNRGQGWVVRKLREALPRIRDNHIHADLSEMLRSHEANIALANGITSQGSRIRDQRLSVMQAPATSELHWRRGMCLFPNQGAWLLGGLRYPSDLMREPWITSSS